MRVSATTLEQFRLYMTEDWMEEASLIANIKGEFRSTPQIELGQAYHSIIEDPDRYLVPGGFSCRGFSFDMEHVRPALDLVDRRGVFEVKGTIEIDGVTLVGRADHVFGASIHEFKTTTGTFDPDKYLNSVQWRVMGLIFEPRVITYHVFCLVDSPNGVIALKSVETMNVYPYPAMREDVTRLVREFRAYVVAKGLDGVLRARQAAA